MNRFTFLTHLTSKIEEKYKVRVGAIQYGYGENFSC